MGSKLKVLVGAAAALAVLAAAGAVALAGDDLFGSGDTEPPLVDPADARPYEGSDACAPIMASLNPAGTELAATLRDAGLAGRELPAALADRKVRTVTCLADDLAGRVEALFVTIGERREEAGVVLLADGTPDAFAAGYLELVYPEGVVDVVTSEGAAVAVLATRHAEDVAAAARAGAGGGVSLERALGAGR